MQLAFPGLERKNFMQELLPFTPTSIIMKIICFFFTSSNYDQFFLNPFKKKRIRALNFKFKERFHNIWNSIWGETYLLIYLQYFNTKYSGTFPLARISMHSFLVKQTFTTKRLKSFTCHNTLSIISCFRQNILSVQLGRA